MNERSTPTGFLPLTARASGYILRSLMDRLNIRYMEFVRYLERLKRQGEWEGIASKQGIRDAMAARMVSPRLLDKLKDFVGKELYEAELARLYKLNPNEFIMEED